MITPILLAGALGTHQGPHCEIFSQNFAKVVACERADGTLRSFEHRSVDWRVRFYVRYWEMPCGEFPTVEEAYVFHVVTNDLYADADLTDADRLQIRSMMFDQTVHCR
ncbi:MAG TPA: hypothetical protein VMU38_03935 [Candidatus Binatia bacterium]|nr:hypothetical protein [Candidatus Binatia bacterium]